MKENLVELNDEETQSIENGDGINDGIYPPTYDEVWMDDFYVQTGGLLEGIGYYNYLIDRHEKAEVNLRTIENLINESIGKDSYRDIVDLLNLHKGWLERKIEESWEEYDDLNQYIKNFENNSIKN